MSMNELIEYCRNIDDVDDNPQLEAKEIIEDENIEEISTVSNQIIPTKEHIVNMFSNEFVENIEKVMSLRVEQLKNSNYKFKFINIPCSFEEKSKEDFKQMFFSTPEMSGGATHYTKNIERTANFGGTIGTFEPMKQEFQGTHKMTFMMTFESTTSSSLGSQFNMLMKNAFPAIECQNQQLPLLHNQHHPHSSNQLERYRSLQIEPPPVITISSSDEAPPAVKLKLNTDRKNTKRSNKENQSAINHKSTKVPIATNSSLKQSPIRVEKKLKRKDRHRIRIPSQSSDDNENDSLRAQRLSDFVKRQRNSDVKKYEKINDKAVAGKTMKDLSIVLVDCMKLNEQLHNVIEESGNSNEDYDVIKEPGKLNEDPCNPNEEPSNPNEKPCNPNEEPCNSNVQIVDDNGSQTDDTISTITSDDEKFFSYAKYNLLRKQKHQLRLHERSIRRGLYSDYNPDPTITSNETSILHPVASSTLITPQSAPASHNLPCLSTTITHPVACSTVIQSSLSPVSRPHKSNSPKKARKSAPKRPLPNNKSNLSNKKIYIIYSSASDSESNSSVSTITSDDVKFFEKDKYDKLREEKHALRALLRAERKKRN